jgi:hypothetical protein
MESILRDFDKSSPPHLEPPYYKSPLQFLNHLDFYLQPDIQLPHGNNNDRLLIKVKQIQVKIPLNLQSPS